MIFLKTVANLPISVTGTHSMSFSLTIRRIIPKVRGILAVPAFYIYGFRFDFLCHTVSIFTASSSPDSARRFNSLYKVKEEYPSGGINFLFSISSCTLFSVYRVQLIILSELNSLKKALPILLASKDANELSYFPAL